VVSDCFGGHWGLPQGEGVANWVLFGLGAPRIILKIRAPKVYDNEQDSGIILVLGESNSGEVLGLSSRLDRLLEGESVAYQLYLGSGRPEK
jgi:hypothetical protein